MYVHAFAGFMLVSHGHSNTGDSLVAFMIVLFLLWRPGYNFCPLGNSRRKKNPLNVSVLKGVCAVLGLF